MKTFTDQLGNTITVPSDPKRIVSLVPSQTELLADLGLDDRIVGITKFCVHPESWQQSKKIVGGTKNFHFDTIESLSPDLIIGNKEENYQEGIDRLRSQFPVWMSDIVTLPDAFEMFQKLGELTDTSEKAFQIKNQIEKSFSTLEKLPPLRTLYLIWKNPWMCAAPGTFIHEMMTTAGLRNCLHQHTRYPALTMDDIRSLNPELIFLSSEPYPFQQKHMDEVRALCPQAKLLLVDGEMFSWYGSRMIKFPGYLKSINPALS